MQFLFFLTKERLEESVAKDNKGNPSLFDVNVPKQKKGEKQRSQKGDNECSASS